MCRGAALLNRKNTGEMRPGMNLASYLDREVSMLGRLSVLVAATLLVFGAPGCNYDFDLELPDPLFTIDLSTTGLGEVPRRMALGSSTVVSVMTRSGTRAENVTSSDPEVVAVDRVNEDYAELHAVGVGMATVSIWDGVGFEAYSIAVAQHERFDVLLVERAFVPEATVSITPAHLNAVVSRRYLRYVVAYYDAEGLLYGSNLARFEPPAGSEDCEPGWMGPFDAICLAIDDGLQVLRVDVEGFARDIVMVGVPKDSIIDLHVDYRPEIADAQPGDTIQLIAAGLTAQGTRVYGIPSTFNPELNPASVLTYQYDHARPPKEVVLTAFGITTQVSYEGEIPWPPILDPGPSLWQSCGGPFRPECLR